MELTLNFNFTAAFNGAGKTRGASRGSGARHAPY